MTGLIIHHNLFVSRSISLEGVDDSVTVEIVRAARRRSAVGCNSSASCIDPQDPCQCFWPQKELTVVAVKGSLELLNNRAATGLGPLADGSIGLELVDDAVAVQVIGAALGGGSVGCACV